MQIRNDYILRMIAMLAEMLRKMRRNEAIDFISIDHILREVISIDLNVFGNSPDFVKQIITALTDENKRAIAIVCLYMKDKTRFGMVCSEVLKNLNFKELSPDSIELLETTFGINIACCAQESDNASIFSRNAPD